MKQPIDRDKQIELMKSVQERASARMRNWMSVPVIRAAVHQPAPGQKGSDGYSQRVESRPLAKCG